MMNSIRFFVSLLLVSFIITSCKGQTTQQIVSEDTLVPGENQYNEQAMVVGILQQYHYQSINIDDSTSSTLFDNYINTLDRNHIYFLESDIKSFEKYRYILDDHIKGGDLTAAYKIFNTYRARVFDRVEYTFSLLDTAFDFSKDEYYNTKREKAPFSSSEEEWNDIWRKFVKSQAVAMKLNGKDWEGIVDVLEKRFKNLERTAKQYTSKDVFQLYLNTFTECYDPHTNYFSPISKENFKINMSQSLEGIGARLRTDNEYTNVEEVIVGGPAYKSKLLHKNDKIIGVGQGDTAKIVDVIGWRIDEVVNLIRGDKGTTVRLEIIPHDVGIHGDPTVIKIVRDKVKLEEQSAKKELITIDQKKGKYKIGVVKIPVFYRDFEAASKGEKDFKSTTRDTRRLINELREEGIDGLIIDLRYNGGGSLQEAVELTGLFIKQGPVVQVKDSRGEVNKHMDPDPNLFYDGPMVVMVNRFSASASEIFSGAIQDYKRGVIVGGMTYGKGTVQNLFDLDRFMKSDTDKHGEVKLTLAKFYRITGSSTQHKGVTPDILLPSKYNGNQFRESSQPSALPWDQINKTSFIPTNDINNKLLEKLVVKHEKRMSTEKVLLDLAEEAKEDRELRNKTNLSLNEKLRKEQRDELEKIRADRKGEEYIPIEDRKKEEEDKDSEEVDETKEEEKRPDPELDEGVNVLVDIIGDA